MEDEVDDKDRDDNGHDMWGQHGSIGEVGGWDGTKGMIRDVKGYDKKYEWWKKWGMLGMVMGRNIDDKEI
jgi:hypothetical protein